MKKILLFLFFTFLLTQYLFAQKIEKQTGFQFELFPSGLNFIPIKANYKEPRLGIQYLIKTNDLKVDIGNSSDLLGFYFPSVKGYLTFGIDFFAYALATSYEGHRLQIDALDGFFGGNGSYTQHFDNSLIQIRLRIIHNSAHLVDGHWDFDIHDWMNGDTPLPYTRDFGELTVAYSFRYLISMIRIYSSVSYSTLVRPKMEKWLSNFGYEIYFPFFNTKFLGNPIIPFVTTHFYFDGNPDYTFNANSLIGVKFGEWFGKGVIFYFDYFNGHHFLSEYFLSKTEQIGIGFFVEFN